MVPDREVDVAAGDGLHGVGIGGLLVGGFEALVLRDLVDDRDVYAVGLAAVVAAERRDVDDADRELARATVWIPACFGVHQALLRPRSAAGGQAEAEGECARSQECRLPLRRWVFMVAPVVLMGTVANVVVGPDGQVWRARRFSKKTVIHVAGIDMAA